MSRLYKAVALAGVAMVAQTVWAQEIGRVTIEPNSSTGEMRADIPARPENETVYIMRDGQRIATAVIKSSGQPGGAVLSIPPAEAGKVRKGDRISVTPDLTKEQQLPDSAYQPVDPTRSTAAAAGSSRLQPSVPSGPPPSLSGIVSQQTTSERTTTVERPAVAGTPAPSFESAASKGDVPEKVGRSTRQVAAARAVEPVSPRLTPRGSEIPLYPAPAIVPEAGVNAPYGVGLAAAAPVGTPYLRSPAFAGPPVIYMPQTVSRVLLPSVTPYPANVMSPPVRYPYSSAPFTRTDVYVNLPYGTYYWPNGYAGTTPVEPQIPVYVTAPAAAVLTSEASYTTQRYAPGAAMAETLNPITVPPAAAGGPAVEADVVPIVPVGDVATALPNNPAPAGAGAAGPASLAPAGAPAPAAAGVAPAPASLPPLEPLSPFPAAGATGAPEPAAVVPGAVPAPTPAAGGPSLPPLPPTGGNLPANEIPSLPPLPGAPGSSTAPPALPALPGAGGAAPGAAAPPAGGNPFAGGPAPAGNLPPLAAPAAAPAAS